MVLVFKGVPPDRLSQILFMTNLHTWRTGYFNFLLVTLWSNLPFSNVKNCHTVNLSNNLGRQVILLNWSNGHSDFACKIKNK